MNIFSILKAGYAERQGIYIPESEMGATVWDTLATNDLLDAATSATSDAHAVKKGETQIETLVLGAQGGIILDVGCGYGRVAENLLPKRTFDAYIGVDGSTEMLRFAQARKNAYPSITTPVYFVYGQIDALPFADASVDTVLVSAVFLHNHKSITKKSLAEIYRVLKPGGKLFVFGSFPNVCSLMGIQGALYDLVLHLRGNEYRNGPVRFFSKHEVRTLLKSYSEVNLVPAGFAFLPKRVLIFPQIIDTYYRLYVANPVNNFLASVLPKTLIKLGATHHDVVASK